MKNEHSHSAFATKRAFRASAAILLVAAVACVAPTTTSEHVGSKVIAQSTPSVFKSPDRLDPARAAAIRQFSYPSDEPARIGGRLTISDLVYANGEIDVTARVNWRNSAGVLVDGILVRLEVFVRAGEEKQLTAFRVVPLLNASGTTRGGAARLRTNLRSENGLMPGEYYVKVTLSLPDQSMEVREAMLGDPSIINFDSCHEVARQEALNVEEEKRIEAERVAAARGRGIVIVPKEIPPARVAATIREDLLRSIGEGKIPVGSNQFKLYVGTSNHWVDDGSLGDIQKIDDMINSYRSRKNQIDDLNLRMPLEKDLEKKAQMAERLKIAELAAKNILESLTFHGYESAKFSEEDLQIRINAELNRVTIMKEVYAFEDKLIGQYLTLLHGDLNYWAWKAKILYCDPVMEAVSNGNLPWTNAAAPLKYGKEGKSQVKDMRTYREYLKERVRILVHGDKTTWPENRKDDPKKADASGAAPVEVRELRGGLYSDRLLTFMLRDIEQFDLMKYLVEEKNEAGKTIWTLNEAEWGKFEEEFRIEMAHTEAMKDETITKQIMAFDAAYSGEAKPTGDRIRDLFVKRNYKMEPTRFPVAAEYAQRAFDAVAYFPMTLRYTVYTDVMGYSGRDLDNVLGSATAFPPLARRKYATKYVEFQTATKDCEKQLERYEFFFPHNYIFAYKHGRQRNLPTSGKRTVKDRRGNTRVEDFVRDDDIKKQMARLEARNRRAGTGAGGATGQANEIDMIETGSDSPEGGG